METRTMKALIFDSENDSELLSMVGTRRRRVRTAWRAVPTSPIATPENRLSIPDVSVSWQAAFTLTELLVVIATMAILAVMLLPALAGTLVQSKTTACEARYRQWAASANLYANDHQGWLPTFNPSGGGAFAWDVGTGMLNALYPYGMDVPDYFCPMRPAAWDAANAWGRANLGHPIHNTIELTSYFRRIFANECEINDNYWVPRLNGGGPLASLFPPDYSHLPFPPVFIKAGNPTCLTYGWPQRLHDVAVPYVPFVSDLAASGQGNGFISPLPASTNVTNLSPNTAHFVNGTLIGVNLAFADGHVISHTPGQMRAVYKDAANYWFY